MKRARKKESKSTKFFFIFLGKYPEAGQTGIETSAFKLCQAMKNTEVRAVIIR
jgi:hypothetical protein